MHHGALRALEFDRVVEAVCRHAQTPFGRAVLAGLQPMSDAAAVEGALAATAETVRFLGESALGLHAADDLVHVLASIDVDGRALEPQQLLALAAFLSSVSEACGAVRRAGVPVPALRRIADSAAAFDSEIADVRRRIEPSGEIADDASPELRTIRERLRKQRARLRGTLESYVRGKDTSKYLQQQIVTDRNGRYVLVVRSEHRSAIPGIIHGSSGSGASLFLEPLSTVEINNDIVALEEQEREEVRRILLELTERFRARADDLDRTVAAATNLDVLQARARLAVAIDGVRPRLAADGRLELRGARHPLLIPAMRRLLGEEYGDGSASGPVPVDILLIPPVKVLVITGPNTGGKTVALKTAGLLALMAQAGLLVPAEDGSQVPLFRSVFADIGDEQSIAGNLSTFSGHIANVVSMERELALPALVLLDEAGAGTDPIEGGALAMAIIDHFRRRGAMLIATTHYDALKSYASTTEGVAAAGFGFDPVTFAPTYRLNYGTPGSSLALEIAARLGLLKPIIDAARAHRSERETQLADHLAKIERDIQAIDHERRLLARERQQLGEQSARLQAREGELKTREEAFRRRLNERIEDRLREARREIDAVVAALKAQTATLAADASQRARLVSTGQTGQARTDARAAVEAIGERLRSGEPLKPVTTGAAPEELRTPPVVGDRVLVGPFGVEGVVKALHGRDAEVDVRGKRLRARVDELRRLGGGASKPPAVRVNVDLQPREGSLTELNVIGCNVDEALARAERFLDEAAMGELRSVRVIHGYGTGQLRRAIAGFLQSHPMVASFSSAPAEQGGGGVTVVEFKD